VTLVVPTPDSVAPPNLAAVVLRLPPELEPGGQARVRLRPERGPPLLTAEGTPRPCSGDGSEERPGSRPGGGRCFRFALGDALSAGRWLVEGPLSGTVPGQDAPVDPSGAAPPAAASSGVAPPRPGAFAVGEGADLVAPALATPLVGSVGGGCWRVRVAVDEPVALVLRVRAEGAEGEPERTVAVGEGTAFDLVVRLAGSRAGRAALVVEATDWAGNVSRSEAAVAIPEPVPAVVISELLANPAGAELTQEFVELANLGDQPVSLAGMSIEDGGGSDPLGAETLAGRARALVVAAGFQGGGADPAPRVGTLLLRVAGRIGRDGLANGGEAVRLRGAGGVVISQYGGWVDTSARGWSGRSVQRTALEGCDEATAWSTHPEEPTPGW
jgi:hypothetical protein